MRTFSALLVGLLAGCSGGICRDRCHRRPPRAAPAETPGPRSADAGAPGPGRRTPAGIPAPAAYAHARRRARSPARPLRRRPRRRRSSIFPPDSPWNTRIDGDPVDPQLGRVHRRHGRRRPAHRRLGRGRATASPTSRSGRTSRWSASPTGAIRRRATRGRSPFPGTPSRPLGRPPRHRRRPRAGLPLRAFPGLTELRRLLERLQRRPVGPPLQRHSRPLRWTSADAAGLPIFPGLVRWDEVRFRVHRPRAPLRRGPQPAGVRLARDPRRRDLRHLARAAPRWASGSG